MRFHNKIRNYLQVCSFGLIAGILARFTDFLPYDSLWNIHSIIALYGLWIICAAVFIWRSTSHLAAGLNVLLFFLLANAAYFGSEFLLGLLFPQLGYGGFQTKQFLYYVVASLICGVAAFILYSWNHGNWYGAIALAIPIGLLAAETITVLNLLHKNHTHLLPVLLDAGFCLYLGLQFRKLTKYKELYTVSVIAITYFAYKFLY